MNSPQVFISGKNIDLCVLQEEDAFGNYANWFNDASVCAGNSHHVYPYSVNQARDYIKSVSNSIDAIVLKIVERADNAHIGNISLQQINRINRTADVALIIGEKSCWGKGYGKEACSLMLEHGFNTLNLRRITCGTFENNYGMIGVAKSLGMTIEGRRRQAVFKDGAYLDIIEYGILRDEFSDKCLTESRNKNTNTGEDRYE